jgi:hypothetical protein
MLLFLASLGLLAAAFAVAEPFFSLLLLIGIGSTGASLILLLRAYLRAPAAPPLRWIVVDGSNVLHWQDETPLIETVRLVCADLQSRGFSPLVWFDANVGYKINDRYMGQDWLARLIGLPSRQVFVAAKGTPADPLLLEGAAKMNTNVVTNDRFRDWSEQFPQVKQRGFLIRGRVRAGVVTLDMATAPAMAA